MNVFNHQAIPERLQQALTDMKFETPTPIQEAAIPLALEGRDIIGCAQTGTGKTAAFAIPMVAQAIEDPRKQMLVLSPTRELAAQTRDVVLKLTKHSSRVGTTLLVGGAMMKRQLQQLKKKPSIIIATPGRLNDHLQRGSLKLSNCSFLVLDEADRMLDMGFGPQIDQILKYLPKERQTLFFSATLPKAAQKLAEKFLNKPEKIEVGAIDQANKSIEQELVNVDPQLKNTKLIEILMETPVKTLVFVRTKRGADKLQRLLEKSDIPSTTIHGNRSQSQRERAMAAFRSGRASVMVATDIAARGLDVDAIELVVNFDLPDTAEDYIHRIGRTGRASNTGKAMSFVCHGEMKHWNYLLNPESGAPRRNRPQGRNKNNFRRSYNGGGRRSNKSGYGSWKVAS